MSRMSVVLVSLLPCIAGAALLALCAMSFLSFADQSGTGMKIVGGMGALLGFAAMTLPVMAFLFTPAAPGAVKPRKKDEPAAAAASSEEATVLTSQDEILATDENLEVVEASDEFETSEDGSMNVSDFDESDDVASEDEDDEQKR